MARGGLTNGGRKKRVPLTEEKKIAKKAKETKKNMAGLHVSLARTRKHMKKTFRKVSTNAVVATAALIQYVLGELLISCVEEKAVDHNRKTILPQDLKRCIKVDVDFSNIFNDYQISGTSGVDVKIDRELVPKRLQDRRDKAAVKKLLDKEK